MGRSTSSSGCPKQLLCVPRGHFPDATFSGPCLPSLGSLQSQWRHFQRERPIAQLTHVLVLDKAAFFVRPLPCRAPLVVMGMLPVVVMVRAARHHVPDLVHELQPHHQRPCGQQRVRGESGWGGDVMGSNHDGSKLAWMVGIWRETG